MWRIVAAVITGYVTIGVLVVITDQIATREFGVLSASALPPAYFAQTLATDTLFTILGGYVCARLAQARIRPATFGLIIFGELMGIISAGMFWGTQPHWFAIALLVLYPPAIWIGQLVASGRQLKEA